MHLCACACLLSHSPTHSLTLFFSLCETAASFGTITEARHVESGQRVAIKQLSCNTAFRLARAHREAQALLRINHPCVVQLLDVFVTTSESSKPESGSAPTPPADGPCPHDHVQLAPRDDAGGPNTPLAHVLQVHMVITRMEHSLDAIISRLHRQGQAIPPEHVRHWALQLLAAIDYLHSCRIVHRDIKPQNILVDSSSSCDLKLCDFGVFVCKFACVCACVYVCVPVCAYVCVCVNLCVSVCICVYLCVCTR